MVPALLQWHQQAIKTYVYSSGSREAQRLLFAHTAHGDLRPHLSGFFDTLIGSKVLLALPLPMTPPFASRAWDERGM